MDERIQAHLSFMAQICLSVSRLFINRAFVPTLSLIKYFQRTTAFILTLVQTTFINNIMRCSFELVILLLCAFVGIVYAAPLNSIPIDNISELLRTRRQFDMRISADHDDQEDETELALEAIANLWRSSDGNTQIEGSAKVVHRSNSLQSGNTRYSATLHVHHDYKRK